MKPCECRSRCGLARARLSSHQVGREEDRRWNTMFTQYWKRRDVVVPPAVVEGDRAGLTLPVEVGSASGTTS